MKWLIRALANPEVLAALKALAVALIALALPTADVALTGGQVGPAVAQLVLGPFVS